LFKVSMNLITAPVDENEVYEKVYVPGLADVAMGWRPSSPTTVYQVSGDDTSGIAGRMTPDGVFHPCLPSNVGKETYCLDESQPLARDQWGTIAWDGIVTGTIENGVHVERRVVTYPNGRGQKAHVEVEHNIVNRRTHDPNELLGDYALGCELWNAIERGTLQAGRTLGRVHEVHRC
jgi:hypothetical protein